MNSGFGQPGPFLVHASAPRPKTLAQVRPRRLIYRFLRCVYEPFQTGASLGFLFCSFPDLTFTHPSDGHQWHNKHSVFLSSGFGSNSCVFGLFRAAAVAVFVFTLTFSCSPKRSLKPSQIPLSLSILAKFSPVSSCSCQLGHCVCFVEYHRVSRGVLATLEQCFQGSMCAAFSPPFQTTVFPSPETMPDFFYAGCKLVGICGRCTRQRRKQDNDSGT